VPGSRNINIRASEEDIVRLKAGAAALGSSMTMMMLKSALRFADLALGDVGEVQASSAEPAEPARVQDVCQKLHRVLPRGREVNESDEPHPSDEIGDLTEQQVRIWLSQIVQANQQKEQERLERLEREAADDLW
jgi:hypothetical protein